jgi:hypothetical protein
MAQHIDVEEGHIDVEAEHIEAEHIDADEDKEMAAIMHYEKHPSKCQAECGGNCKGAVSEREFVCRYRPNPGRQYGGDFKKLICFCDGHYSYIIAKNNGVRPEPYYEYYLGEAIYNLLNAV